MNVLNIFVRYNQIFLGLYFLNTLYVWCVIQWLYTIHSFEWLSLLIRKFYELSGTDKDVCSYDTALYDKVIRKWFVFICIKKLGIRFLVRLETFVEFLTSHWIVWIMENDIMCYHCTHNRTTISLTRHHHYKDRI